MKRFQYRLETVLNYKNQVLEDLRSQHGAAARRVAKKQEEIDGIHQRMDGYCTVLDGKKKDGCAMELRLYDMCIARTADLLEQENRRLAALKDQEQKKRAEVIRANVDAVRYEKLKEKRWGEYQTEQMKREEAFIEEFVSHAAGGKRHTEGRKRQ